MILDWQSIVPVTEVGLRKAYITLPSFSIAVSWAGASEIVKQWEYSASQDLTLELPPLPQTTFVLCVKFERAGEVIRYKLWNHADLVLAGVALYAGEQIESMFRLEVWSVSSATTAELEDDLVIYTGLRSLPTDIRDTSVYVECVGIEKAVNPISGGEIIEFSSTGLIDVFLNRLEDFTLFGDQILRWKANAGTNEFSPSGITNRSVDGAFIDDTANYLPFITAGADIDSTLVVMLVKITQVSGSKDNVIARNAVGVCNVDISNTYFQMYPDDSSAVPILQLPFIEDEFVILSMAMSNVTNPFAKTFGYFQLYRVSTEETFDVISDSWVDNPIRDFTLGDGVNFESPLMYVKAVARYGATYTGNNYTSDQFRSLIAPLIASMLKDPNTFPIVYE